MMLGAGPAAEPHEKAPHWELVGGLALLRAKGRETIVQMVQCNSYLGTARRLALLEVIAGQSTSILRLRIRDTGSAG
jgi:hypothetical protein